MTELELAHAVPAAAVWAAVGIGLSKIGHTKVCLWVGICYALIFGASELLGLPLRAPTRSWQVPRSWVSAERGFHRQALAWGATLGPGLMTRNPFAAIWMVVPMLAASSGPSAGAALGAAIGAAHGLARAAGIVHNIRRMPGNVQLVILRSFTWRLRDGLWLVAVGSYLCVAVVLGVK